jgi:HEAT repeat protein
MDPRVIAEEAIPILGTAPTATRLGLLDLIFGLYTKLGGVYSSLDVAMSDQIRSLDPTVARKAIEVCTQLGVREAYLPLREIASRPGAALREDAVAGLARLSDPRAVPFFKKLLDENSMPHDEIYQALGALGRPSALLLKSKLDDPDAAERRRALDALLPMATAEDLSGLYAYIQKYPPDGDLKKRIYDVIATIESQSFERPLGTGD